jgi:hypothetical protein
MKVLIVTSEIKKNKYSACIRAYKIIESIPYEIEYDILTEPMTVWDFEHRASLTYTSNFNNSTNKITKFKSSIYVKVFRTTLNHINRTEALYKKLKKINLNKYNIIISLSGGGFFGPQEAVSKIKTKAVKIGLIHDPFPIDVFPEPYKAKANRYTVKAKKSLKKTIDNLDLLAFPSKLLAEWMDEHYNFGISKSIILPHLLPKIKIDDNSRDAADRFLDSHGIKPFHFFLHAGTLLKHRPIHSIIKVYNQLYNEGFFDKGFKLVFIGSIKYEVQDFGDHVVIINKRLPLNLINAISQKAKALMIIEHIGAISPFLPGKLPECIAHKKPIMHFGPKKSEICRIAKFETELIGFNAELNNPEDVYNLLKIGGKDLSSYFSIVNHFNLENFFENLNLDEQ